MKKYAKYLNLLTSILLIVSIVLMLACTGITGISTVGIPGIIETDFHVEISGITVLFGGTITDARIQVHSSPLALIGFILTLVGLILICLLTVLKLIKGEESKNIDMIILCGALFALIGGIFTSLTKISFVNTNDFFDKASLSGGYITAAILAIVAGIISSIDPVIGLLSKE